MRDHPSSASQPLAGRQWWDLPLARRTRLLAARYGVRPRQRLGQSFLINEQAAERLAATVAELQPPGVVEIGGGLGALSVPLLRHLPRAYLQVYEIDPLLCQALADLLSPAARRCQVHCADVLEADFLLTGATPDWVVVGNLPYAFTTPILEKIFTAPPRWRAALVMVQLEFAQRLLAAPGSRTYGALSVFAQYHCKQVVRLMELAPGSFWPAPQVSSVALLLWLRRSPPRSVRYPEAFAAVVRGAFCHRRKTLLRALATAQVLGADEALIKQAIAEAGLDPRQRPETLDLKQFAALTAALVEKTGHRVADSPSADEPPRP